jgi:hypothetical protein
MNVRLGTTPAHDLLDSLAQVRASEIEAANDRLVLVAAYLLERPPRGPEDVAYDRDAGLFGDRALSLAGEGAVEVSEFAVMELGPVLGMSLGSVRRLAGDVMELAQRLPRVWARVSDYSVEGWRARQVADLTKKLSPDAAGWVDAQIAPILHKRGRVTISRLVGKAFATFDPEGAALAAEESAEQFRVDVDLDAPTLFDEDAGRLGDGPVTGHAHVDATMDLADAADLENALAAIAKELGGDDRFAGWSLGRRRAKALGELARRYTAGNSESGIARVLHLYCHVDQGDLRGTGLVSVDNYSAIVPVERVDEWALAPGTVVSTRDVPDPAGWLTRNTSWRTTTAARPPAPTLPRPAAVTTASRPSAVGPTLRPLLARSSGAHHSAWSTSATPMARTSSSRARPCELLGTISSSGCGCGCVRCDRA